MQNREKQIDYKGFANQMRQNAFRNAEGNIVCSEELWELIASTVEAKPADLAEEIFAEIDDFQRTLRHIFLDMCGGNDYNTLNLLQIDSAIEALFDSRIAELKKKYTEDKK